MRSDDVDGDGWIVKMKGRVEVCVEMMGIWNNHYFLLHVLFEVSDPVAFPIHSFQLSFLLDTRQEAMSDVFPDVLLVREWRKTKTSSSLILS